MIILRISTPCDLVRAIEHKSPYINLEMVLLHQDNASTKLEIDIIGFETVKQAPYSPDLTPMDFRVFPFLKHEL